MAMLVLSADGSVRFSRYARSSIISEFGSTDVDKEVIVPGNSYMPLMEAPPPNNVHVHVRVLCLHPGARGADRPLNVAAEALRKHYRYLSSRSAHMGEKMHGDVAFCLLRGFGNLPPPQDKHMALEFLSSDRALLGHHRGSPVTTTPSEQLAFLERWLQQGNVVERSSSALMQALLRGANSVQLGDIGRFSTHGAAGSTPIEAVYVDLDSCYKCGVPVTKDDRHVCAACGNAAFCAKCKEGAHSCTGVRVSASRTTNLSNFHNPPKCAHCSKQGSAASPLHKCSTCKAVMYCGRECQLAHWKLGHKADCAAR